MTSRFTWPIVLIALIGFGFIYFLERPVRDMKSRPVDTHIFPSIAPNSVTNVTILPEGQLAIKVQRTNSAWQIVEPISYPAETNRLNAFLNEVLGLRWQLVITTAELQARPDFRKEFGFSPPRVALRLAGPHGEIQVQVGANSAAGDQVYLQVVGGNEVYLCDAAWLKLLPSTPHDWRDTLFLHLASAPDVIKVRSGKIGFELQESNRLWKLTKPLPSRASNEKTTVLLSRLLQSRVHYFVTDATATDMQKFGLQTPELELTLGRETNVLDTIEVGDSPTNLPKMVFVRHANDSGVYLLDKDLFEPWRASHNDFRERRLLTATNTLVRRIAVSGLDSFSLERSTNGWTMTPPFSRVDQGLVEELIVRLTHSETELEKGVVTDFTTYGLAPPLLRYKIELNSPNPTPSVEIHFGTNQVGQVFARRTDEDSVVTIKPEDFAPLPCFAWQMQDRSIWNFNSTNVVSVSIQQKGLTKRVIRNAAKEWVIAPGFEGYVDTLSFDEAIYRLGELRAAFWVSPDEKDRSKYGFREADHQVTLELAQGGQSQALTLEFGGMSPMRHPYAAVEMGGKRRVFEMPWGFYYQFVPRDLSVKTPAK